MIITSLSPSSVSPVIKQAVAILGSGFGTDKSAVKVYMHTPTTSKQLKVLKIEPTKLTVGFPGSPAGTYHLSVKSLTTGVSIADPPSANVLTAKVVITSISPNQGSGYGGALLTIRG